MRKPRARHRSDLGFEYQIVHLTKPMTDEELEILNGVGGDGWEVILLIDLNPARLDLLLKRKIS